MASRLEFVGFLNSKLFSHIFFSHHIGWAISDFEERMLNSTHLTESAKCLCVLKCTHRNHLRFVSHRRGPKFDVTHAAAVATRLLPIAMHGSWKFGDFRFFLVTTNINPKTRAIKPSMQRALAAIPK